MVPKFRAWYTPFKGKKFGQEMIHGRAGSLISHAEMSPDNYVLMQSTGLKDKNGVEIFEGDIVIRANEAIGYVAYLQQEAGFVVVLKKSDYRLGHRNTCESYDVTTNHEVIGNIHSNPELLDKSNEN
jgi:uncharacterized phage protein (TIGR01671 family)